METIIDPKDYTPEVIARIETIKNRMRNTLVSFSEDDIKVIDYGGTIYILANPLLGSEPIFDDNGNFVEMIPMYNLTIIHERNWIQSRIENDKVVFTAKIPRLRILRPDLCDRIIDER